MLKKITNITCKQATHLASKKEAGNISFFGNLQLKVHYKVCSGCRRFAEQTSLIGKTAKHTHEHKDTFLSTEMKEKIKQLIRSQKFELLLPALFLFSKYAYCIGVD
jgi:hypothetical protein